MGRLTLAVWSALTCIYAALCSLPFVHKTFIEARHYPPWVGVFLTLYPIVTAAVLAAAGIFLPRRREWFIGSAVIVTVSILRPLSSLAPGLGASLIMTFGVLPLLLWETLIALPRARALNWNAPLAAEGASARLGGAAAAGALCAWASLFSLDASGIWSSRQWVIISSASALQHALLFAFAAALLEAARRAARSWRQPQAALVAAEAVLAFLALRAAASVLLLNPLDMRGVGASAAAWFWSAAALTVLLGAGLARRAARPASSSELLLPALGSCSSIWARAGALALAAAAPYGLSAILARSDWNGMILMIGVCASWTIAFAALRPAAAAGGDRPAAVLSGLLIVTAWLGASAASAADPVLRLRGLAPSELMARASTLDPSLRIVHGAARWSVRESFFETLRRNTNISREELLPPRRIDLVSDSWTPSAEKPPIIIIVIDSLRQDYIGAYNPAARFTPAIDAFAREGIAWKKAFTAYGATGLSEPSIWAGSLLIHKLYVTPFAAMNSLERLLDRLNYRKILTNDTVVNALWTKNPTFSDLEAPGTDKLTLCQSLKRVDEKLSAAPAATPLFFYSQPQDIHISIIEGQKRSNVTGKNYSGFDAAYASRLESLDACFGRFISDLKRKGLYDKSLIVLTSDHGDSLGEEGRWGHAYTIFPEILRVPLIMRLPKTMAPLARVDHDGPAFLIDIAPTIYQLLGRGKPRLDPLLGRPLITLDGQDPASWRKTEQLVVSSYGPVYGLLREAKQLFISDGVNFRYHHFDLEELPAGRGKTPSAAAKREAEKSILGWLDRLNAFWGRRP